jgi:ABC-type glycerol-3-phosphate transport system substrate-binding protein
MRGSLTRGRRAGLIAGLAAGLALAATLAVPAAAHAAAGSCDDLLVTITPTGSSGDVYAAAVTAQVLEADAPGWASVTWDVPPSTALREVLEGLLPKVASGQRAAWLRERTLELYERAKELKIEGRSKMDKSELAKAIRRKA